MSTEAKPGIFIRLVRRIVTIIVTLVVLGGAGAATFMTAGALAERAADAPEPTPADLMQVAVTPLTRQAGFERARQFIGQVEAQATVDLSFELGGRITSLTAHEGDLVKAGDKIAELDTALLRAEENRLNAARAATVSRLEFTETRLKRAEALKDRGFVSQEALDQAQTTYDETQNRLLEIDAQLDSLRINLEKSALYAPFDGRIGTQFIDAGTTLSAGQPVARLIASQAPELRLGLPLDLDKNDLASAKVTIAGAMFDARLLTLRPDIDPVTRTRTALFAIETDVPLIFGQTVTLSFTTKVAEPGAWVPLDALQESIGGAWSVLVVEEGLVRPALVEILHVGENRAYVRGSFEDGAQMIQTGAHRVVPGQSVIALGAGA